MGKLSFLFLALSIFGSDQSRAETRRLYDPVAFKVDASSTNIPTSYGSGSGSKVTCGLSFASHIQIFNETSGRLALNLKTANGASAPTSANSIYVLPGTTSTVTVDDAKINNCIYMKSDTGSPISSGTVEFNVW